MCPLKNIQQVWTGGVFSGDFSIRQGTRECTGKDRFGAPLYASDTFEAVYTDAVVEVAAALALSDDGLIWDFAETPHAQDGIILEGVSPFAAIETCDIIKRCDIWYLFYTAYNPAVPDPFEGFPADLFVATSTDGVTFTNIQDTPVIARTSYYDSAIYAPDVLYDEIRDVFLMVFSAYCLGSAENGFCASVGGDGVWLMAAESSDAINWTIFPDPLLGTRGTNNPDWMALEAFNSTTVLYQGEYLMFLNGTAADDTGSIGLAQSATWPGTWTPESTAILSPLAGSFYSQATTAPSVLMDGSLVRMWFTGFNGGIDFRTGYGEADIEELR